MINKQYDKYIIFIRFYLNLDDKMRYSMRLKVLSKNDINAFIKFIDNWVSLSKKNKTYVNIWKIQGNTLIKIAYIEKGVLNSL